MWDGPLTPAGRWSILLTVTGDETTGEPTMTSRREQLQATVKALAAEVKQAKAEGRWYVATERAADLAWARAALKDAK
jgi:hypothetical protein